MKRRNFSDIIDTVHKELTRSPNYVQNMEISKHYKLLGTGSSRTHDHPLYHKKNNIYVFGDCLENEWVKYYWHNLNMNIQCVSTIDCGMGKELPHPANIMHWDHIDSETKIARIRKEMERGYSYAQVAVKVSIGHLIAQTKRLTMYRSNGRAATNYKCTLWHDNPNNESPLYYELNQCRPLCPNCHAIQSAYENRTRTTKTGFVLGWMEKDVCDSLVEKQEEHLKNEPYYSGSQVCGEIKTDPKLLELARKKIDEGFANFVPLSVSEFKYLSSHPDYYSGIMNQRNFTRYIVEYRKDHDLFLKN